MSSQISAQVCLKYLGTDEFIGTLEWCNGKVYPALMSAARGLFLGKPMKIGMLANDLLAMVKWQTPVSLRSLLTIPCTIGAP